MRSTTAKLTRSGFLDHLSTTQTDPVAFGGLDVLGHCTALGLGSHMRGDAQCRQGAHEFGGVVTPIRSHGGFAAPAHGLDAALDHHRNGIEPIFRKCRSFECDDPGGLETEGEAEIFNAVLKYRRVPKFYYPRDKYGRRV